MHLQSRKDAKFKHNLVISTKEKSHQEARQRLDSDYGVTYGDFSSVELRVLFARDYLA